MIGWRVGWVAGPEEIMADIGLVGLINVVCQVGIAQHAQLERRRPRRAQSRRSVLLAGLCRSQKSHAVTGILC
jgi:aspartate/methionine/tyrosine aminotransferase